MKYVDIAVAILVGASAITGILLWTPGTGDLRAREMATRAELRDRVAGLIQAKEMSWFLSTPPQAVCSYFADLSNSTVRLHATVDGTTCGGAPPVDAVRASISFRLESLQVDVEAWSGVVP